MMDNKKVFSIIVPVYQNEANLKNTIPALLNIQEKLPDYNMELIFVDDGSTDDSYNILVKNHRLHEEKIKVIKFTKNFGQIAAIQAGLKIATGDCAGIISADLQDPPELFVEMIKKWESGVKFVIAEREKREENFRQTLISSLYWRMIRRYAIKNYPIGGFDFCLIDRQIVSDVNRINEKNTHTFALIFSLGYPYEVMYYTRKKRTRGKSQWTLPKKMKLFIDMFVGFSYFPIRAISFTGLMIAVLGFAIALIVAIDRIIFGNPYTGWTTIVVLISFLGGLNLLTLGIIGEYLWRILDEVRERPYYVIEKILGNQNNDCSY
jgi:dolichol-phosphate mannosyltransferase